MLSGKVCKFTTSSSERKPALIRQTSIENRNEISRMSTVVTDSICRHQTWWGCPAIASFAEKSLFKLSKGTSKKSSSISLSACLPKTLNYSNFCEDIRNSTDLKPNIASFEKNIKNLPASTHRALFAPASPGSLKETTRNIKSNVVSSSLSSRVVLSFDIVWISEMHFGRRKTQASLPRMSTTTAWMGIKRLSTPPKTSIRNFPGEPKGSRSIPP